MARVVLAPADMPVGIITALLGRAVLHLVAADALEEVLRCESVLVGRRRAQREEPAGAGRSRGSAAVRLAFIATARAAAMTRWRERIALHREERGSEFTTFEEPLGVAELIERGGRAVRRDRGGLLDALAD